jgi:threonine aldolase
MLWIITLTGWLVIFEVKGRFTPQQFAAKMKEQNILMIAISPTQVRMVTHLDITAEMIEKTHTVIKHL